MRIRLLQVFQTQARDSALHYRQLADNVHRVEHILFWTDVGQQLRNFLLELLQALTQRSLEFLLNQVGD